jgi:hypothetical protein
MSTSTDDQNCVSVLGTLSDGVVGSGRRRGLVRVATAGIEVDWWIGADDGWLNPSAGDVHTTRSGLAPAIDARVRVPGGETVLRAYAVAGSTAPVVVVELENASAGAVVVAWVVRAAPGYKIGRVAIEGSTLLIDQRARVNLPGPPSRWAVNERSVGVHDAVVGGKASGGRFEPISTRRGDLEVAVLFPVAHRTRTRIAATTQDADRRNPVSVARLPTLAAIERGWVAALEHGTQVELPDEDLQATVDAARATVLLGATVGQRRTRIVTRVSSTWGLTPPDRHPSRVLTRRREDSPWPDLHATTATSGSSPRHAAEWLATLQQALIRVEHGRVDVLPNFPAEWMGRPVALHNLASRHGPLSFALRWHGPRPALLWEVPPDLRVRASSLDPSWEGHGTAGEALLAEIDPTRHLLPLRTSTVSEPGVVIDQPGSFM